MKDFDIWWHREGSAMRPLPGQDSEEHARRVARIAWENGAFCEARRQQAVTRAVYDEMRHSPMAAEGEFALCSPEVLRSATYTRRG